MQRKKRVLLVLRILVYSCLAAGLIRFSYSSFLLRNLWLPLAAYSNGATFSAGAVSWSPFSRSPLNFFGEDLHFRDSSGGEYSIREVSGFLNLRSFFSGTLKFDSLFLSGVDCRIGTFSSGEKTKLPTAADLQFGAVEIKDLKLSLPLSRGERGLFDVRTLSISSLIPDEECVFRTETVFTGYGVRVPFRAEFRLTPDWNFIPSRFLGTVDVTGATGKIRHCSLDRASGSVYVESGAPDKNGGRPFSASFALRDFDCLSSLDFRTKGSFSFSPFRLDLQARSKADFSNARLKELYMPHGEKGQPVPENLHLEIPSFALRCSDGGIGWDLSADAALSRFIYGKYEYLKNAEFHFRQKGSFDLQERKAKLSLLEADLISGEATFKCVNSGAFEFTAGPDGIHLDANNSSLRCSASNLPVRALNPFLPVEFSDGVFSMDSVLSADSAAQKLSGHADFHLNDLVLSGGGRPLTAPCSLDASMSLRSTGLDRVRSLSIESGAMTVSTEKTSWLTAGFSGNYDFLSGNVLLAGEMSFSPYDFTSALRDPLRSLIRGKMDKFNARGLKTLYRARLASSRADSSLSFEAKTTFNSLSFLGKEFAGETLDMMLSGSSRILPGGGDVVLDEVSLSAPGLIDFHAEGKADFASGDASFRMNLKHLSDSVCRGLFRLAEDDSPLDEDRIRQFRCADIQGEALISGNFDKAVAELSSGILCITPEKGSRITLTLDRPFSLRPAGEFRATAAAENLAFPYFNIFLPPDSPFQFTDGRIQGTVECVSKDSFRTIVMTNDLLAEKFMFRVHRAPRDLGDCRATGETSFSDFFSSYNFHNARGVCLDGAKEYVSFLADGFIRLDGDYHTFLRFTPEHVTPHLLRVVAGGVMDSFHIRKFSADGSVTYEGTHEFDNNALLADLAVNELDFDLGPSDLYASRILSGKLALSFLSEPESFSFRNSVLQLNDSAGIPVLHLGADGSFHKDHPRVKSKCRLYSEALDLEFWFRALSSKNRSASHSAGNTLPLAALPDAPAVPADTSHAKAGDVSGSETLSAQPGHPTVRTDAGTPDSEIARPHSDSIPAQVGLSGPVRMADAPWPFRGEPPALRLYGYKTELSLDFANIVCTPYVKMSLTGIFDATDETLSADHAVLKINDSSARGRGRLDFSKEDGYEYEGVLEVDSMDVSPLIKAALALKGEEMPRLNSIRGKLESMRTDLKGKGLSLDALDKNMHFSFSAKVKDLSVPTTIRNSSSLMRILFLPVESLPRLIEFIPQQHIRLILQKIMGNHLDLLTGRRNIEFEDGEIQLESNRTDIRIRKMYFVGPVMKTRIVRGSFNPFYNEIDLDSMTNFSGVNYPLSFRGKLDDPRIDYPKFLLGFFRRNTFSVLDSTVSAVTLGFAGTDGSEWSLPAEDPIPDNKSSHPAP